MAIVSKLMMPMKTMAEMVSDSFGEDVASLGRIAGISTVVCVSSIVVMSVVVWVRRLLRLRRRSMSGDVRQRLCQSGTGAWNENNGMEGWRLHKHKLCLK